MSTYNLIIICIYNCLIYNDDKITHDNIPKYCR